MREKGELVKLKRWRAPVIRGTRVPFLGVMAQVVIREEDGKIVIVAAPSSLTPIVRTRRMIDPGIVYKSTTVIETVQEVLRQRSRLNLMVVRLTRYCSGRRKGGAAELIRRTDVAG